MEADWKDLAKRAGAWSALIIFLVWLFTPSDPRFNRK
jgi:hypothetical protein